MSVGIIILNWNNYPDTIDCVNSIASSRYPNYQVIVIDNGSTDGSPAKIREAHPRVELLTSRQNLGFAGGAKLGIDRALDLGVEYVFFLNNDTIVAPKCIAQLIETAERNPNIDITVPKIYYYDNPTRIWSAGARWRSFPPGVTMIGFGEEDGPKYNRARKLDYATGCALLVHRRVIETIGSFDPTYFMYQEDYDFCYRARQAGFRISYVPQAKVWHKVSQGLGKNSFRKWYLWSKSAVIFYKKHFSSLVLVGFLGWAAARETLKGNFSFLLPFLHGVRDGLRDLTK